jgi:hypothetical protein
MGVKLVFEETFPLPERQEPEGGWRPTCRVEDHTWQIELEAGSFYLVCLDAHTEAELDEMEPNGPYPGCQVESEYILGEVGPFKLRWVTEYPRQGYNDSGSHGSGCDCDHWLEPVMSNPNIPVTDEQVAEWYEKNTPSWSALPSERERLEREADAACVQRVVDRRHDRHPSLPESVGPGEDVT